MAEGGSGEKPGGEEPGGEVDGGGTDAEGDADGEVLLRLPESARSAFKEPIGPVFTDADALLSVAGDPVVAVGDVVTYHLVEAGRRPDVAVVDGITRRGAVEERIRERVIEGDDDVPNPAATLTAELLGAIREALDAGEPTTIVVDGEEDLATLPAVLAAPEGASVVYGQPGEGMVHVPVTAGTREGVRELFDLLTGDRRRALSVLGVDPGES